MAKLIAPTTRLHVSWLKAHAEWGPGVHEDGFGLMPSDETVTAEGFSRWVARLASEGELTNGCLYQWIVDGDAVLGGIALRYGNNEFIESAGHIGYGIRPSARRRGLATWALGQMVTAAGHIGIDSVNAVCAADNLASAAMLERSGGIFDGFRETKHGLTRRYVFRTAEPIENQSAQGSLR